ncbi:MAG: hypothetical protein M3483_07155, partial [Gemmatimonadota bacterium]|nr:hypothetical protein [Gemmatimonadota bacterium]
SYLAAALEDERVRIPPAVASRFTLPPPAFLWGALGVIRPPADARLLDASVLGERTTLRYALDAGEVMTFHAEGGILRSVRRLKDANVLESIERSQRGDGTLSRAEYRDPRAFRTLVLTHESTVDAASFPESTWYPAGAPR